MAKRKIENYLLKTTAGLRIDAGVSPALIRGLINEFAGETQSHNPDGDIVSFLSIEDIPQDRREKFLLALNFLPVKSGGRASS
jgi:hypothetical protein